uniref:DOT1 domain-containing protein n=1 Tax=Aureoumbra lagunensis TaxID=44058 RepID=A0A7S3NGR3_9STRA|mmetsp:Transcript_2663/g.3622  ORF Transcript_2663/g.3622 Transcript_2663/m.3622 type:complete len:512 (+) Transcript_2663:107-1642(+)
MCDEAVHSLVGSRRRDETSKNCAGESTKKLRYTCHEDGVEFDDLDQLQRHLKAKTAWSNRNLVGCRVSVLLENREWSDGMVTQYHRTSGKHCVEFRQTNARRWLVMLRTAFYIVDRCNSTLSEETKEPDGIFTTPGKNCTEAWTFAEDLSLLYAKAQSTLHECYGSRVQETGHKTVGHTCVTEEDKRRASQNRGSLLYGELLPRGVNKALDERHMDARRATILFDLGMGTGKVPMQAFLQFPNLKRVYGVELSVARYRLAEKAYLNLANDQSHEPDVQLERRGLDSMVLSKSSTGQSIEIAFGNLFHTRDIETADIIMLETEIPTDAYQKFAALLDAAKEGARILTYLDLRKVWQLPGRPFPFRQLESNRSFADRYPTSWSVNRGHHLFLWVKVLKPSPVNHLHLNLSELVGTNSKLSSTNSRLFTTGTEFSSVAGTTNSGTSSYFVPGILTPDRISQSNKTMTTKSSKRSSTKTLTHLVSADANGLQTPHRGSRPASAKSSNQRSSCVLS